MITRKLHILFNVLVSLLKTRSVSLWLLFSENGHVLLSKFRLAVINKILFLKRQVLSPVCVFSLFFFFLLNLMKSERISVAGKTSSNKQTEYSRSIPQQHSFSDVSVSIFKILPKSISLSCSWINLFFKDVLLKFLPAQILTYNIWLSFKTICFMWCPQP